MKWLRLYNEIIDDKKTNEMSPKLFKFFIFLLCLASECEKNGAINLSKKEISWRLRMSEKRVAKHIEELVGLKIISANPSISFINWNKRQYKSDNSTERSKKWRDNN